MADTEAISNGRSDASVRSRLKTSTAKMIAAIGALKILDIAPAAAHPISKVRDAWFIKNIRVYLQIKIVNCLQAEIN